MRARVSTDHQAAVDRRLALLRAELNGTWSPASDGDAATAPAPTEDDAPVVVPGPATWWGGTTRVRGETAVELAADDGLDPISLPGSPGLPDLPVGTPVGAPPSLPVPGRHASRRAGESVWARVAEVAVPDTLRGRLALSPGGLTTVALVLALGLGLTCWFLVRARPSAVPVPAPSPVGAAVPGDPLPSASAGAVSAVPSAAPSAVPAEVTVDVAGRVRRPGIAVLPAGSRVVDALKAAGGARAGVDLTSLNLARVLVDGEQILVGVRGEPASGAQPPASGSAAASAPDHLVDLNTADAAALEALPEVGPVTAQAIIAYRTEHGGFASVDELLDVDGIGEATLAQIRPWVTV